MVPDSKILYSGFQTPEDWIPDSKVMDFGFYSAGFRNPKPQSSWMPDSLTWGNYRQSLHADINRQGSFQQIFDPEKIMLLRWLGWGLMSVMLNCCRNCTKLQIDHYFESYTQSSEINLKVIKQENA